jgi:hypothetical protein
MIKCANFMQYDMIRKTVEEWDNKWGSRDELEKAQEKLTDLQMGLNCGICDYGEKIISDMLQAIMFDDPDDPIVKLQQNILKISKKPLKRKCFKEMNGNKTN